MAFSTINKSSDYQNTVLYTGNASTQAITGVGFQPDFTWIKNRTAAGEGHHLYDAVRGVTKRVRTDTNALESTVATGLTTFGTDGFTVGSIAGVNGSTNGIISWNWKAGTTTGITTNGSTTITPSAYSFNTTSGCSIVKFTGTATSAQKIPHGLGAAPKFMMLKRLGSADDWYVYHYGISANPSSEFLIANTTAIIGNSGGAWSDTEPDSVNFTVGSRTNVNGTDGMIAYCFAPISGYSKFGSYEGNANVNGTFINTGFKPSWVMFKNCDGLNSWEIRDDKRSYNLNGDTLWANNSDAGSVGEGIDFLSNGFKCRASGAGQNGSATYVYAAFGQPIISNSGVVATAR
jgi:hypothetical protein|tara:strand:+ start:781 stop:1821 length:1041 start_codon:yes stop_codon:yes gene_type:complete